LVRPELAGIGAIRAARARLASVAKRSAPAISPTGLAATQRLAAALGDDLGGDVRDHVGDLDL
jgi:hypothetical protein